MRSTRTGRNATLAVVPTLSLLLTIAAATPAAADFGRLAALADELRADLRTRPGDGGATPTVVARVRTAAAAGPAAGCGFAFLANDDATLSAHVPRFERAACAAVDQRVQFVRPDAAYEAAVTVPAGVDNVTFTSNGGDGLEIDTLCLGFFVRGGGGGPQAFCVDRRLLDACAGLAAGPDNVSLGRGGIRLSRAFAGRVAPGCKEIVFRDVGGLARGFESLARGDGGARSEVCSRIGLVAETSAWAYDPAKCYAQREDATAAGGSYYVKMDAGHLRDRCTHAADDHDAATAFTTAKTSG